MTYVGCYSLDVYCDAPHGIAEHVTGTNYAQFTGRTLGECVRQARDQGWLIRYNPLNECICPKHNPRHNRGGK